MDYRTHMENGHGWGFPPHVTESEIEGLHAEDHKHGDAVRESYTMGDHIEDHAELDYGTREVVFQPYVHVKVLANGRRLIGWDWNDTLQGEVTAEGTLDAETPLATEISGWLDDEIKAGRVDPR